MSIGNWYRVGTVSVQNGNVNVVGTNTFWTTQTNPGDRFTVDGENWYEIVTITDDTHMSILSVGGSGAFAGATAANLPYAIDRNFNNALSGGLAAQVAALLAQFQAGANGPLSGLFQNGSAATPGIAFLNEASTGLFRPAAGIAALAVQGAEFLRAVGTVNGVPAMLGLGTAAPAQMVDLAASNSALWGVRMTNSSAGTAARAGFIASNGVQNLNIGVNGAHFTANGVLTPARGFVEAPTGLDFASGVTAGNAFTWGVGAGYASKMAMDYQGNVTLTGGSLTLADGSSIGAGGYSNLATYTSQMWTVSPTINFAGTSGTMMSFTASVVPQVSSSQLDVMSIAGTLKGAQNVNHFVAMQMGASVDPTYTGALSLITGIRIGGLGTNAPSLIGQANQILLLNLSNGNGTTGFAQNNALNVTLPIAAAGAGGTVYNIGLQLAGTGGTGGAGTTKNYPIYSSSTATSYVAGPISNTGGDYAENRKLIPSLYGAVAAGALLGYDANGLMTNVYADVVGRVLPKSTSPSYIGNDIRSQEAAIVADYGVAAPGEPPVAVELPPAPTGAQLSAFEAYEAALDAYRARWAAYEAAVTLEAVKWDVIALCGVVPVNLAGLTSADIGKYLVPCAAADGTITATAVARADLTLGQYIDSFGTIELIGADGRPMVNVKNA